jgi:hypothetical protein
MRRLVFSLALLAALAAPGAAQMPAPMPMPAPTMPAPMPMPMPQTAAPSPMPMSPPAAPNVSHANCPANALTPTQVAALQSGDLHAGNFNECVATLEFYGMSRLSSCRACAE